MTAWAMTSVHSIQRCRLRIGVCNQAAILRSRMNDRRSNEYRRRLSGPKYAHSRGRSTRDRHPCNCVPRRKSDPRRCQRCIRYRPSAVRSRGVISYGFRMKGRAVPELCPGTVHVVPRFEATPLPAARPYAVRVFFAVPSNHLEGLAPRFTGVRRASDLPNTS